MSSSTFHLFSSLPCELRLMIWKQAIRPTKCKNGLHYFSVFTFESSPDVPHMEEKSVVLFGPSYRHSEYAATVPVRADVTDPRSAYLWDAGVWTACKESRAVILEHFQMGHWTSQKSDVEPHKLFRDDPDPSSCRFHCETYSGYPISTTIHESQKWELVARPFDDIFCFRSSDWFNLTRIWRRSGTGFWLRSLTVQHIALELDRIWDFDWPNRPDSYIRKYTRGFIAELVHDVSFADMYFQIWLIDRDSRWRAGHGALSRRRTFYDCEQEFVEVYDTDCDVTESLGEGRTARDFIWHLAGFDMDISDIYLQGNGAQVSGINNAYFYYKRFINVLAPKNNFIQ